MLIACKNIAARIEDITCVSGSCIVKASIATKYMTRERDTKKIREIKLMRNMTALISLSKTTKEKKEQRFFFSRMEVVDQM